jgi:hypothetical protein
MFSKFKARGVGFEPIRYTWGFILKRVSFGYICWKPEECPEGQIGTPPHCKIPPEAGGDGEIDGSRIFIRVLDICRLVNGN